MRAPIKKYTSTIIVVLLSTILLSSCTTQDRCHALSENFDLEASKKTVRNPFSIYKDSDDYLEMLADTSLEYLSENVAIPDEEVMSFPKYRNMTSLDVYKDTVKEKIVIDYYYFTKGCHPIYPVLITSNQNVIIRGRSEEQLEVSCNDGKLRLAYKGVSCIGKYNLTVNLPFNELEGIKYIIFEPTPTESHVYEVDSIYAVNNKKTFF